MGYKSREDLTKWDGPFQTRYPRNKGKVRGGVRNMSYVWGTLL